MLNPGSAKPKSDVETHATRLERERLELDNRRIDFEQRLARDRFEFEKATSELEERRIKLEEAKAAQEGRLLNKYFGTVIAAIVSLAAVLVSVGQVITTIYSKDKELVMIQEQKASDRELQRQQQKQEWNLNTAKFFTEHNKEIFSSKPRERDPLLRILFLTFPKDVIDAISEKDPIIAKSIQNARNRSLTEIPKEDVLTLPTFPNVKILTTPRKISRVVLRETYDTNLPRLLKVLREGKVSGSYQYVVDTSGNVHKVFDRPDEFVVAWHSGTLSRESIGIGLLHKTGENSYPQAQLQGLVGLLIELSGKHNIPPEGIITSSQVPPFKNADIKDSLGEIRDRVQKKDRSTSLTVPKAKGPDRSDAAEQPPSQSKEGLEDTINKIIMEEFAVSKDRVSPDARFHEDLGVDDNLDMVEFVMRLDEKFGLSIPDEDLKSFKKVKDVYAYIQKHRRK